jgi:hypothetical protein
MSRTLTVLTIALIVFAALAPGHPIAAQECKPSMTFMRDLSLPDGTMIAPGSPFEKAWLVKNTGTCAWSAKYAVSLVGGDVLAEPKSQPIGLDNNPAGVIRVTLMMEAP